MANCNKLFWDFNKKITPTSEQMQKMKTSREALEKKISDVLQKKLGMTVSYYTQGSGAKEMKTIIIKNDGTYDADRGVYLPEKPEISAKEVQRFVFDAVKDHTDGGAEHRQKCIRVLYKCVYNIDFPIYYEVQGETYSYLAIKDNGWIRDDPSKMIEWFNDYKDDNGQLLRLAKYIKVWASKCSVYTKMPSGIALTVWGAKNFMPIADRDDECLLKTLIAIRSALWAYITCVSPVEPYDDLTAKLSEEQKNKFRLELDSFCIDAQKAVDCENQKDASLIWRKYFGDRFPVGLDENIDKRAGLLISSAAGVISQNAKLDRKGIINQNTGVQHQQHRNYGG